MNTLEATIQCFKATPESLSKSYEIAVNGKNAAAASVAVAAESKPIEPTAKPQTSSQLPAEKSPVQAEQASTSGQTIRFSDKCKLGNEGLSEEEVATIKRLEEQSLDLTPKEEEALEFYTSSGSGSITRKLEAGNADFTPKELETIHSLDNMINNYKTQESLTLYRGYRTTEFRIDELRDQSTMPLNRRFLSTSIRARNAVNFSRDADKIILRIDLPEGSNCIPVKYKFNGIQEYDNLGEGEIILPRNTTLLIRNIIKADTGHYLVDVKAITPTKSEFSAATIKPESVAPEQPAAITPTEPVTVKPVIDKTAPPPAETTVDEATEAANIAAKNAKLLKYIESHKAGKTTIINRSTGKPIDVTITHDVNEGMTKYKMYTSENGVYRILGTIDVAPITTDCFTSSIRDHCGSEALEVKYLASALGNEYRGIGTQLMQVAVEHSIQHGYEGKIVLLANNDTPYYTYRSSGSPVPFYRKLGFSTGYSGVDAAIDAGIEAVKSGGKYQTMMVTLWYYLKIK